MEGDVQSKVIIHCSSFNMEHTFYMFQPKEEVVAVIKGFIADKKNPILTMITDNSHFIYPIEMLKTSCIIIVEDCYIASDAPKDEKITTGKIVKFSDINKRKK